MVRSRGHVRPITVLALAFALTAFAAADFDAAVRRLERAVAPQRDGSHLPRLLALRKLGRPTLTPLFRRLVDHDEWQIQVHAILGLAELEPARGLDPALLAGATAHAQQAVVATALDTGLLHPDDADELLAWEGLQPLTRLLLIAERAAAGGSIPADEVAALAVTDDPRAASLAALLAREAGDPQPLDAYEHALDDLRPRERADRVRWMLDAIRQYRLTRLLPWVMELSAESDRDLRQRSLLTALVLDPVGTVRPWRAGLGDAPSYGDQVRYGLLLLMAGPEIPVSTYDELRDDHALVQAIAAAGRARSAGADPAAALIALLDSGHIQSSEWAMQIAEDLPPARARAVWLHLLATVDDDGPGQAERIARGVTAASRLFESDPDAIARRLAEATDDGLLQQVILLGLFDTPRPEVGSAVRGLRRIGAGRADALALLLLARHTEQLEPNDLDKLGRIAAGGGRVSEGLQVQAAWLYLEHIGETERALARAFEETSTIAGH